MTETEAPPVPLIVEVDGGLLRTDLWREGLFAAIAQDLPRTLLALRRSRHGLSLIAAPDPAHLPYRPKVLATVQQAARAGRTVILISKADQSLLDALARDIRVPGTHLGEGQDPAQLVETYGREGFDFIGRCGPGTPLFDQARKVIAVAPRHAGHAVDRPIEQTLGNAWTLHSLMRELRPHQWVKNLLLLLPLLAAHVVSWSQLMPVLIAMAAFCAGASAIYIVNDLLDLRADRMHPEKRNRPVASGLLPLHVALSTSLLLAVIALGLGFAVSVQVGGLIAFYMALSLLYSMRLKALRWVDLGVLTLLYTLRVFTGAAAAGVAVSDWLAGFVCAVFLTLGAVKRLTGLARVKGRDHLPGRGYALRHMPAVHRIALAGVLATTACFLAYSLSPAAQLHYDNLWLLRLTTIPMVIWLLRMIRVAMSGNEDYDPILFVARDRIGQAIMALGVAMYLLAI